MRLMFSMLLFSAVVFSCSAKVEDHAAATPEFDLYDFFEGKTKAWGMVQDFSGKQIRRFEVTIAGTLTQDGKLVLDEDFVYDDGETQNRVWTISRKSENHFVGNAGDVVGEAHGRVSGNALNWQYTLRVQTDNGEIDLLMDDWMFRHNDRHMFNVTTMKKLGVTVGKITLFFEKQEQDKLAFHEPVLSDGEYHAFIPEKRFMDVKPAQLTPAVMDNGFEGWRVLKGNQSISYRQTMTVPVSRMF